MQALTDYLETPSPYHLRHTLRLSTMGSGDPTVRLSDNTAQLSFVTPAGPVTVDAVHRHQLTIRLYGPGDTWLQPRLSRLFGLQDTPQQFHPTGRLRQLVARLPGTHLPRLPVVSTRLMQIVLQQLVTWDDATRAWRTLTQRFGEPAPGPLNLRAPPTPAALKQLGYYDLVACGIIPRQARLILRLAAEAARLERLADASTDQLIRFLRVLPGVGPWTVQYLRGTALGEPDAVVTGDYGLPHAVAWFLRQQARSNDAEMLQLLEPFRPHRFRVQHLIMQAGIRAPRRGPGRPGHRSFFRNRNDAADG